MYRERRREGKRERERERERGKCQSNLNEASLTWGENDFLGGDRFFDFLLVSLTNLD